MLIIWHECIIRTKLVCALGSHLCLRILSAVMADFKASKMLSWSFLLWSRSSRPVNCSYFENDEAKKKQPNKYVNTWYHITFYHGPGALNILPCQIPSVILPQIPRLYTEYCRSISVINVHTYIYVRNNQMFIIALECFSLILPAVFPFRPRRTCLVVSVRPTIVGECRWPC